MGEWMYSSTYTSVSDGGEWSALCLGHFTPGDKAPGTHSIGGWVSQLGCSGEEQKSLPLPGTQH